jgi:chorismate dehydratase
LFERHWKKEVRFIEAQDESYLDQIKGKTAGLIIGDRALKNRSNFPHIFDLGFAWREMTGLPFVFAVWVSKLELDERFIKDFSEGLKFGVSNFEPVIAENSKIGYDIRKYYASNISYGLNENMKKSFIHFLNFT